MLKGKPFFQVKVEECSWVLQDKKDVVVQLEKVCTLYQLRDLIICSRKHFSTNNHYSLRYQPFQNLK